MNDLIHPVQVIIMILVLICAVTLISCNPFPKGSDNDVVLKKEMEKIQQKINDEIGEARAEDETSCRALPIGAKPCGGPWKHLPYSVDESDEEKLRELADQFFLLNSRYNEVTGQMSDCMYVAEPPVTLEDGRCVISHNQ